MFADILKKVVDNVDGGLGAVIMGLDGIPVETYTRQPERVDVNTVGMEFSFILTQAKKAADSAKLGAFEEMTIKADQLTLALRLVTPQYFVAIALLSMHLAHGASSWMQSLGLRHPKYPWTDKVGPALMVILFLGYMAPPTAVLLNVIKLPGA